MSNFLKHYNMRITALSPIHISDGKKIGKKEYILLKGNRIVVIPDIPKMFGALRQMHKDTAYMEYALRNQKDSLAQWLISQGIGKPQINEWSLYSMDSGDAFVRQSTGRNDATPKEILAFAKDGAGMPYVPGSSIKGMLRTALLAYRIYKTPSKYNMEIDNIRRASKNSGKRNSFLGRETTSLEAKVFHTLSRNEKRPADAVNSLMAGFIVSDSRPISYSALTLAQKIDVNLRGDEKSMPILRESIKPDTHVDFEITIDSSLCDVTIEEVLEALDYFNQVSYDYFYSRFDRGSQDKNIVWMGGGTGFLSKTIIYPIFEERGVSITDSIFKTTLGKQYQIHKHTGDVANGIAPHVCKCTRYDGVLYDMGMGRIEVRT